MTRKAQTDIQRLKVTHTVPPEPGQAILSTFLKGVDRNAKTALRSMASPRAKLPPVDAESTSSTLIGGAVLVLAEITGAENADTVPTDVGVVAKPPNLRGASGTRTVNGEAQEILPPYAIGDKVYVMVCTHEVPGAVAMDINVDARAWAES